MELILSLGFIILAIGIVIISPFLNFCVGWIVGFLIKLIFGATFIEGLSMININITSESIPLLCGTLAVIGSFFKSSYNKTDISKKRNNNKYN